MISYHPVSRRDARHVKPILSRFLLLPADALVLRGELKGHTNWVRAEVALCALLHAAAACEQATAN